MMESSRLAETGHERWKGRITVPTGKRLSILAIALMSMISGQSPVQAQSKTGQNNAIILQNQGANNPSSKAIILQNQGSNNAAAPGLAAPKALPPNPCKGGSACK
jgi:hypothetical protein